MARHDAPRSEYDFPSCPSRPPTTGLYVTLASGRFTYQNFCSLRAARYFLDCCLDGHTYTWRDNNTIITDHGTVISTRGHHLTDHSLDHIISARPGDFTPPEPYATQWQCFARDVPYIIEKRSDDDTRQRPSTPIDLDVSKNAKVTPRRTNASSSRREGQPRARADDLVTIQTVAASLNIDASRARAALRKAQVPKPPGGWAFDPSDVARITTIIKENL